MTKPRVCATNKVKVRPEINSFFNELVEIRRELHMHPELGFEEERTSAFVEHYLKDLGLQTKRLAGTGVMATIEGSSQGKTVALRADMDALPIQEENTFDFKSKTPDKMHACGHDGHTAILLCTAKYLQANKNEIKGNVRLLFQPAEEGLGGARPMIKEGCLSNPRVDAIFGLHLWSPAETGCFMINHGPQMAAADKFELIIEGQGGHGAMPHEAKDSIVASAAVIQALQSIVSRNVSPFEPGVITIGKIDGGANFNIIAQRVKMFGTLRAMNEENRNLMKKRVDEVISGVCKAYGVSYKLDYEDGYPVLVNNEELTSWVRDQAVDYFSEENISVYLTMGGEDFSYYAKEVPASFFFLGCANEKKGITFPHHHPRFDIDEDALVHGLEMMTRLSINYLNG